MPLTREQWDRKSLEQQWQYIEMLERLYAGEEPAIAADDTGQLAIYQEINGIDDSDRHER